MVNRVPFVRILKLKLYWIWKVVFFINFVLYFVQRINRKIYITNLYNENEAFFQCIESRSINAWQISNRGSCRSSLVTVRPFFNYENLRVSNKPVEIPVKSNRFGNHERTRIREWSLEKGEVPFTIAIQLRFWPSMSFY